VKGRVKITIPYRRRAIRSHAPKYTHPKRSALYSIPSLPFPLRRDFDTLNIPFPQSGTLLLNILNSFPLKRDFATLKILNS
jgi:hypothetical protein